MDRRPTRKLLPFCDNFRIGGDPTETLDCGFQVHKESIGDCTSLQDYF